MPADERSKEEPSNGSPEPQAIRVRFGKRPDQLLDIAWAESILCRLSEDYAQLFGRLLAEAMIGPQAATAKRGRPST